MAYDETLAARIREIIGGIDGEVTERKMFGGLAFMLNGHMFTGVVGDELMLRLGDAGAEGALRREHVREMDFTGRPDEGDGLRRARPARRRARRMGHQRRRLRAVTAAEIPLTRPPELRRGPPHSGAPGLPRQATARGCLKLAAEVRSRLEGHD